MEKWTKKVLYVLILAQLVACFLIAGVFYGSVNGSASHTERMMHNQALLDEESKLRERVDHVITYIEWERERALDEVRDLGMTTAHSIHHVSESQLYDHMIEASLMLQESPYGRAVEILLSQNNGQRLTLYSKGQREDAGDRFLQYTAEDFIRACPYWEEVTRGSSVVYVFATRENVDAVAQEEIYRYIHEDVYGTDGYVWVNEIVNYNGGENYAIRRIHPNLKETEGEYLSTDMADAQGNLPYQAELDGINEDGEIFHTYYFKNLSDDEIAEKASYAKLYKPFDWIVATGEPVEDIVANAQQMTAYNQGVFQSTLVKTILALVLVFALDVVIIWLITRWNKGRIHAHIEQMEREQDKIFQVVAQHSNRTLYSYDLETRTTSPYSEQDKERDLLAHMYTGTYSDDAVEDNDAVAPDSFAHVKQFFGEIHSGQPSGEMNLHVKLADGQLRWYHFKYSNIFEGDTPRTALISVEDITERHAYEISHLRQIHAVEQDAESPMVYIECDLTEDLVESITGPIFSPAERDTRGSYTDMWKNMLSQKFRYEDYTEASKYFSCQQLLAMYEQGVHTLRSEWKTRYNDYTLHWLNSKIVMVEDPYNGHVKASLYMWDVTAQREEQMSIIHRADCDIMTGLLRKSVGEARIRKQMEQGGEKGGILILLDLDDLKGINDTLGHKQGDAAITGIAETLRSHFRRDDILVRAGGDEFAVFLTGAGQSVGAVEKSMTALLKKISQITVGENGERTVHCSAGCAVEIPGKDTYEALFKRADVALYQVKRGSKNNFAFYVPEMEQEDYEFRSKILLSGRDEKKFALPEMQHFLDAVVYFYQMVLLVDVSGNVYHIMEEIKDGIFSKVPSFGSLDEFVELAARGIHGDDLDGYFDHLARPALLRAYQAGESGVRHCFRFYDGQRYRWVECQAMFYVNEEDKVCDITLLRWLDGEPGSNE